MANEWNSEKVWERFEGYSGPLVEVDGIPHRRSSMELDRIDMSDSSGLQPRSDALKRLIIDESDPNPESDLNEGELEFLKKLKELYKRRISEQEKAEGNMESQDLGQER